MSEKYTPGPWVIRDDNYGEGSTNLYHSIHDHEGSYIVSTWSAPHEGNARLISQAPNLLAMLEHAVHWHDQLTKDDIARYQAVISKAKGE